jgi:hypothetical protein
MATPSEFHLFQALPSELRLRIWGIALSIPRSINITCDTGTFQRGIPRSPKSFRSSDRPPALLHVCRESRLEALRVYKPFFQTESSPKYIYVAFSQDTIKASDSLLQFLRSGELQGIRKMAIDIKDPAYFGHFNVDILKKMQPNLIELELIVEQGELYRRHPRETYPQMVTGDIRQAMATDPGWRCPEVKIVDGNTGKLFERILGDMAIPTEGAESNA